LFKIFQALEEGVEVKVEAGGILTSASPMQTATLGQRVKPGKGCAGKLLRKGKIICAENFLHSLAQVRSITGIVFYRCVTSELLGPHSVEYCCDLAAFSDVVTSVGDGGSDKDHGLFSDSEWESSSSVAPSNIHMPVMSKALSNLMGLYASESEGNTNWQTVKSWCGRNI
jgi:hypothetical protein